MYQSGLSSDVAYPRVLMEDKDHFRCETLNCTLNREACGRRFIHSESLTKFGDRGVARAEMAYMPCRACPTGKEHSKLISRADMRKIKTGRLGHALKTQELKPKAL